MGLSSLRNNSYYIAVLCAILGAVTLGLEAPLSKQLFEETAPIMTLAFCIFGGTAGLGICALFFRKTPMMAKERSLRKTDMPVFAGVVITSFITNILFYIGLDNTSASTGSVLFNFLTVATALIAWIIFREKISKRLWIGIIFITLGSIALSVSGTAESFTLSFGAVLIIVSLICLGLHTNILNKIADRNPIQVICLRNLISGAVIFGISLCMGDSLPSFFSAVKILFVGFIVFALPWLFIMHAQRTLKVAKTAAITGLSPLIGAVCSFIIFQEEPQVSFLGALVLIIPGMYFAMTRAKDVDEVIPEEEASESPALASMNTDAKEEARNYVTAFGFMSLAALHLLVLLNTLATEGKVNSVILFEESYMCCFIAGIACLLSGIVLFILRKRVFAAVTFFLFGVLNIFYAAGQGNIGVSVMFTFFALLLALIFLTSKEKQKYLYFSIIVLYVLAFNLNFMTLEGIWYILKTVFTGLSTFFLLYLSLACASQKHSMPLRNYLTVEENISFNKSGTVLAFLTFASYLCLWITVSLAGSVDISPELIYQSQYVYIGVFILLGVLMLFIGKNRFSSFIFISIGFTLWMSLFAPSTVAGYMAALMFFLIGSFAVFRNQSTLLFALMLIGCGFAYMCYEIAAVYPELISVMVIIEIFCLLVCIYHAFAVFADKPRLPLF